MILKIRAFILTSATVKESLSALGEYVSEAKRKHCQKGFVAERAVAFEACDMGF